MTGTPFNASAEQKRSINVIPKINSFTNFGSVYLSPVGRENIDQIKSTLQEQGLYHTSIKPRYYFDDIRSTRARMTYNTFKIIKPKDEDIFITAAGRNDSEIELDRYILYNIKEKKLDPGAYIVPDYENFPWHSMDRLTPKGMKKAIEKGYFTLEDLQKEIGSSHLCKKISEENFDKLVEAGIADDGDYAILVK